MVEKVVYFLSMIFVAIKVSVHTFIFPGHQSSRMLGFAVLLLILSLFSSLLGFEPFLDWRGILVAILILTLLLFLGRKEPD